MLDSQRLKREERGLEENHLGMLLPNPFHLVAYISRGNQLLDRLAN